MKYRIESDFLGEMKIPSSAYTSNEIWTFILYRYTRFKLSARRKTPT